MKVLRLLFSACLLATITAVDAALVEEVFEVQVTLRTIYDQVHTHNIQVTSWRDDSRPKAPLRVPMLWLYSENDRYWGKLLPKKCFDGFVSAGGQATLVELPRYKDDGLQALRAIASPGALHSKSF